MTNQNFGEFLMVGFDGFGINEEIRRYVIRWEAGGVILFGRNILDLDQLRELCEGLSNLRKQVSDLPLLIAIDQEGGTVARLKKGVTVFPGNMALGFRGTYDDAYSQGMITGCELRKNGINMNLAPVLDLYSDQGSRSVGLRSLGGNPEIVSDLGIGLIKGMQEGGIIATAKHFPGKGRAKVDSHEKLPVIEESAQELLEKDILPFQKAIDIDVKAIMTSHAAYPAFERGRVLPGTVSSKLMTGLLRDALHFRGILISDDLGMGAIRFGYTTESAAVESIRAGVDILLLCHDPAAREKTFAALSVAVKENPGLEARMEESRARIKAVKSDLELSAKRIALNRVPEGKQLALRIARKGISIEKNHHRRIPMAVNSRLLLIRFEPEAVVEVEGKKSSTADPAAPLRGCGFKPVVLNIPLEGGSETAHVILNKFPGLNQVIIAACDAYRYPGQKKLIKELLEEDPDAILVVTRDPRDAKLFPRAQYLIITRGYTAPSLRGLAEVLAGKIGS